MVVISHTQQCPETRMGDYSAQISSAPGQDLTCASGGLSPAPKSLLVGSPSRLLPQVLFLFIEEKQRKTSILSVGQTCQLQIRKS